MSKYILFVLVVLFFGGCAQNNMQTHVQKSQKNMKKALVKLIKENRDFKATIKTQELKIEQNQEVILQLRQDVKKNKEWVKKQTKSIKYLALKIKDNHKKLNKVDSKIDSQIKKSVNIIPLKAKRFKTDFFVEVVGSNLNLRSNPSMEAAILSKSQVGDRYKVLDKSDHEIPWYKVSYDNEKVWLYSKFVKKISNESKLLEENKKPIEKPIEKSKYNKFDRIKVDVNNANLRFKPNLDAKIVAKAKRNEIFNVLEIYKNDYTWYKVIKDALPVWVYSGLVKKMKDEDVK